MVNTTLTISRRASKEELSKPPSVEEDRKRRHRSLFHWRRAPSTPDSPLSDSDHTSTSSANSPSEDDHLALRRRRYPYPDEADSADEIDMGGAIRREMRERRYRRWDPVGAEANSSRVTLAQLLAEELAYAHAPETMERELREREGIIEEGDEVEDGSAEGCTSDNGHGSSEGGHGSSEGGHGSLQGSDESGMSGSSGMWEGSSEETSDGHAVLLNRQAPPKKRGRSKLRRRRPPPHATNDCVYRSRSRSGTPSRTREPLVGEDGIEDVGCLPCSIGVRRSIRYFSSKLRFRRPEEIPPALQALVERPMSPEEYHQYFLSLYLKEGEPSDRSPRTGEHTHAHHGATGGDGHSSNAAVSGHDRHTNHTEMTEYRRPDHVRASTR
ncbi:hypothetical protein NMY22_g12307 [Coprinellus aureogranulatus]|nr:hypothetical protein NMY22_g12307 [Coprinellus aureogranulatus]